MWKEFPHIQTQLSYYREAKGIPARDRNAIMGILDQIETILNEQEMLSVSNFTNLNCDG